MLDFINEQFNDVILSPLFVINSPDGVQMKQSISSQQLQYIEEIYLLFDEEGKGYIEGDRILLLYQVLLFSKLPIIKCEDYLLYKKHYLQFCQAIGVYEGKLSIRLFKQYFVVKQIISEQDLQSIKYYFYQFVEFQRFKLIDKAFYLSLSLSSKQKALWTTNIKNKVDSSNFIRQIQKSKKFNKLLFENLVLCEQYVRILYLFLIENYESLKYYFDSEKKYDLQFFSEELTRIFNSSYSQHQAIVTMIDNINNLFLIFSDAYQVLFRENGKIFSNFYSSFQQQQTMPVSSIKQISLKSSIEKGNSPLKSYCIELEISDYRLNKNKSENYIFEKKHIAEEDPEHINEMTSVIERDSQIISPIKQNVYKQYNKVNTQQPAVSQSTMNNISYLTNPQLKSNAQIFSPIKNKAVTNKPSSYNSPLTGNIIQFQQTQPQINDGFEPKTYSLSTTTTPQRPSLGKNSSLSPQKQSSSFSYLDYLKSSIQMKKLEQSNPKENKIQSMVKSSWVEVPQKIEGSSSQPLSQSGFGIRQVYQSLRYGKPSQVN